jgi:hypothetical protein
MQDLERIGGRGDSPVFCNALYMTPSAQRTYDVQQESIIVLYCIANASLDDMSFIYIEMRVLHSQQSPYHIILLLLLYFSTLRPQCHMHISGIPKFPVTSMCTLPRNLVVHHGRESRPECEVLLAKKQFCHVTLWTSDCLRESQAVIATKI